MPQAENPIPSGPILLDRRRLSRQEVLATFTTEELRNELRTRVGNHDPETADGTEFGVVLRAVASATGVPSDEITRRRGNEAPEVAARYLVMWGLRAVACWGLAEVARDPHWRTPFDHTTVIRAVRRVEAGAIMAVGPRGRLRAVLVDRIAGLRYHRVPD